MNEDYEFHDPYEGLTPKQIRKIEKERNLLESLAAINEEQTNLEIDFTDYAGGGYEDEWSEQYGDIYNDVKKIRLNIERELRQLYA